MPGSQSGHFLLCALEYALFGGTIFGPDSLRAELGDQRGMGGKFFPAQPARQRTGPRQNIGNDILRLIALTRTSRRAIGAAETKRSLTAADHLDIDFGQQFGVEQRSVLGAMRIVDAVAPAERIQRIRTHGVLTPGHGQRVDHHIRQDRRPAEPCELRIDEAHIEGGVVGDPFGVAEEFENLIRNGFEGWFVLQRFIGDAVDGKRIRMHFAVARIDIEMQCLAGREMVDELDAADFDDTVRLVVEARGFRIENDFAHVGSAFLSLALLLASQIRDDLSHLLARRLDASTRIDDVVRTRPLFRIRRLAGENHIEFFLRHTRSGKHSFSLNLWIAADDDDLIQPLFCAGFKQQRNIEHNHISARLEMALQKLAFAFAHERMNDSFQTFEAGGIARELSAEFLPVDPAVAGRTGKGRLDQRNRFAAVEIVDDSIGIIHGNSGFGEEFRRG
ncbi:hypothetical protein RHSP_20941 [Rhizobium freirei PRF 81]|uniref:Uncharacterized protein n=1 Tax=Rhizobium freirei PRF 81 TaxID=363754 RepID=N6UZJ7_9HYPH|nr:hypothetical protein RHSP_20941 [Rhizobium freirei PRF 81]